MPPRNSTKPALVLSWAPALRVVACLSVLALLSACATNHGRGLSASQEAAQYQAHAQRNYVPPGPPYDPWGPYIVEASQHYDVPVPWIREVMRAESSGKVMDTSPVGAMGLMQVMPETYDELRARYSLGDDPYNPRDNVMAGTAYIREMYNIYGFPGFLAAYNAGPKRLDDYLSHNRPLPDETRHYVAKIAPNITGIEPNQPSPAANYAMNQLPMNIPPGPRYPHHRAAPVALAENRHAPAAADRSVQMAALDTLPVPPPAPAAHHGFRLIAPAMADTLPVQRGGSATTSGRWGIQVGAYSNESQARAATDTARSRERELLAHARPAVGTVRTAHATLYRARLTGLSRDAAVQACEKLGHGHSACIVLSPDAQG